jgi:hypothetical protein
MACLTRCVLSWETNRQREDYFSRRFEYRGARLAPQVVIELHILNLRPKLVFRSAQPLLETTQKLILFALGKHQIVVSQLTVFLFKFAFDFVPAPLHL